LEAFKAVSDPSTSNMSLMSAVTGGSSSSTLTSTAVSTTASLLHQHASSSSSHSSSSASSLQVDGASSTAATKSKKKISRVERSALMSRFTSQHTSSHANANSAAPAAGGVGDKGEDVSSFTLDASTVGSKDAAPILISGFGKVKPPPSATDDGVSKAMESMELDDKENEVTYRKGGVSFVL
jgi:hypothetical protein